MSRAVDLDREEEFAALRAGFDLPPSRVYLDGNSLGPCSRAAERALAHRVAQWKADAVEAWRDWIDLPQRLAARIAPLIGATPTSVAVCGSTTTNLHQLLCTLYKPTPTRRRIVIDASAFPSDAYAVQSHLRLHGLSAQDELVKIAPRGDRLLHDADWIAALDDSVALVLLPAVVYTTGQLLPLKRLVAAGRERGAIVGVDCSHSIGAVPHELDAIGADFAFWCSYKYLNAGPGAVGGLYLNARHHGRVPGLAGWFGNRPATMFEMRHDFEPAADASALQIGTPHIFSLAPLEGSLEVFERVGLEKLRARSLAMTDFLIALADERLAPLRIQVVTPRDHASRGGHVALAHPRARDLSTALRRRGVVPDFRPPDILRLAPAPLYNTFAEIERAINAIDDILRTGDFGDVSTESVT